MRHVIRACLPEQLRRKLRESPIARRLAGAALWSVASTALVRVLAVLAGILLARIVGKGQFGVYSLAQSTVSMLVVASGFGMGVAATRYVAKLRLADPERVGRTLTLCLVCATGLAVLASSVLLIAAEPIATHLLGKSSLAPLLRAGALAVVGATICNTASGALIGFEAFARVARLSVLQGALTFAGTAGGAVLGGTRGALLGMAAASWLTAAAFSIALITTSRDHHVRIPAKAWYLEARILIDFGLPWVASTVMVIATLLAGQAMLARSLDGANRLADFAVGLRWSNLVSLVPSLVCAGYLPVLSSLASDSPQRRRRLMWATTRVSLFAAALAALAVWAAGPWILAAYGSGFTDALPVLGILSLRAVIESANLVMRQSLTAMNRVWIRALTNVLWTVSCVVGMSLLIPHYGAVGMAIAIVIAQALHLGVQAPLAYRSLGMEDASRVA